MSDNEVMSSNAQHRNLRRRELRGNLKLGQSSSQMDGLSDGMLQRVKKLNSLKVVEGGTSHSGLKMAPVNGSPRRGGFDAHLVKMNYRGDSDSAVSMEATKSSLAHHVKEESHVLRRRTASSHRAKPYSTSSNHKASSKS